MSATTKLGLYNAALGLLHERKLSGLTEEVEPRRVLDEIWDRGAGAVQAVLEQGLWNFATRTSQLDASTDITISFGHTSGFETPSDYVRLIALSGDEFFNISLTAHQFVEEAGTWYASIDPIYIRYVSNDASYGANYALWPETFTRYVESYLAAEASPRVTKDAEMTKSMYALAKTRRIDARSKDAMNEGTALRPVGSWQRARRRGYSNSRSDRGTRSSLIG